MHRLRPFFLAICCVLALGMTRTTHRVTRAKAPAASHGARIKSFRLAITVDDLPGGGPEIGEFTHPRIVADIIATLRAHHVKHAAGFVVGGMLEDHPERQAALEAWVQAGYEVGNHTYSHRSLAEIGLPAYLDDIWRDRAVTDPLEKATGQRQRYFRYPYLEEGRTEAERRAITQFLAAEHYKIARISIDFADWAFADAYGRCLQRQNRHALDLLGQSYLANAVASLRWSMEKAHEIVGHSIPSVLLLHANVATANYLDALLTRYESLGAQYIPLSEALSESVYTASYNSSGGDVLVQAGRELKRKWSVGPPRPLELLDLACEEQPVTPPLL
jgi:peptidoglycan/xylan/chitin deacetylase (PgdA/CDA1 family)